MSFNMPLGPLVMSIQMTSLNIQTLHCIVFVYLDDILIISEDQAVHLQHVQQVRQRLLENKIFVKAEKFDFSILNR